MAAEGGRATPADAGQDALLTSRQELSGLEARAMRPDDVRDVVAWGCGPPPRMAHGSHVQILQRAPDRGDLLGRDPRVDGCGLDTSVAQHHLDLSKVRPVLQLSARSACLLLALLAELEPPSRFVANECRSMWGVTTLPIPARAEAQSSARRAVPGQMGRPDLETNSQGCGGRSCRQWALSRSQSFGDIGTRRSLPPLPLRTWMTPVAERVNNFETMAGLN